MGIRAALRGKFVDLRTAWIRQSEHFGDFIKSFSSSIITGFAQQTILTYSLHVQQHGVAAADNERHAGTRRTVARHEGGEQMALHVIHGEEGLVLRRCQRLGHAGADEQRADKSGPGGGGKGAHVGKFDPRLGQHLLHEWTHMQDVIA